MVYSLIFCGNFGTALVGRTEAMTVAFTLVMRLDDNDVLEIQKRYYKYYIYMYTTRYSNKKNNKKKQRSSAGLDLDFSSTSSS